MKAIFIPINFNPETDLEELNKKLKNAYSIESNIRLETNLIGLSIPSIGNLLIVSDYNKKDKLKKLNKISKKNEKGTTDNSL